MTDARHRRGKLCAARTLGILRILQAAMIFALAGSLALH